jgi:ubiquinone/menaquinone biosynthesis C-methylase UbiE
LTHIANTRLFSGFAELYDANRPGFPKAAVDILTHYLGKKPKTVIDLGCGTGLSTAAWATVCERVIGVEPNADMHAIASRMAKQFPAMEVICASAEKTDLPEQIADIVVCSQSFHWMNPGFVLREVDRLLRAEGVFSTVDYDWPAVASWRVEAAFESLSREAKAITREYPDLIHHAVKYKKAEHLSNMGKAGVFRYTREFVFCNTEKCTAERYVDMALSQSSIQAILRARPAALDRFIAALRQAAEEYFGAENNTINICYRMRIGIK